ncbi:hypothetical protein ACSNOI_12665 [Actinomadura kijaniata]|uniref:hypothetical protein n=1 Tax=Actinomadura kijaniata TaxID=46161 RepID=UPI003F1DE0AF
MRVTRRSQQRAATASLVSAATLFALPAAASAAAPADGAPTPPRLKVSKRVSDRTPLPGQRITYTVVIRNVGLVPAYNVRLTDHLPAGVSATGARARGCRAAKAVVRCRWAHLRYRGSLTVAIAAVVDKKARPGKRLTNTAVLTYGGRTARSRASFVVARPKPAKPQTVAATREKKRDGAAVTTAEATPKTRHVTQPHRPQPARRTEPPHKPTPTSKPTPKPTPTSKPTPKPKPTAQPAPVDPAPSPCPPGMTRGQQPGGACAPAQGLPRTGAPVNWLVVLSLLVLGAGSVIVIGSHVRSSRSRH